jgi:nucleotide-binding universal stress UspA family protein
MPLERVLFAIDRDDESEFDDLVDAAVDVAGPADATVALLYVFRTDDYEAVLEEMGVDVTTDELTPDEVAARHERVRAVADELEARNIDHEIHATVGGDPATQVVRRADQLDADALVIGGRERSPAGKAIFGDRSQQILLNASCPVVYVNRD